MFDKDLGPAHIYADSVSLGAVQNIHITVENQKVKQADSRFGSSAKGYIYTGSEVKAMVNLAESTIETLAVITPGTNLTGSELMFSNPTGQKSRDNAVKLEIKLIVDNVASTDPLDWITIFVADPDVKLDLAFDGENERIYPVEFEGLPVISVPSGETYAVGDKCAIAYGETS